MSSERKNIKKLRDSLISSVSDDNLDKILSNSDYALEIKNDLLYYAISKNSKNCAEYLVKNEATISNLSICFLNCKFNIIREIYELVIDLTNKYGSFSNTRYYINKIFIIERLLEPSKVSINRDRLTYVVDLCIDGFLDFSDVRNYLDSLGSDKREKYKSEFRLINRELLLTDLGL